MSNDQKQRKRQRNTFLIFPETQRQANGNCEFVKTNCKYKEGHLKRRIYVWSTVSKKSAEECTQIDESASIRKKEKMKAKTKLEIEVETYVHFGLNISISNYRKYVWINAHKQERGQKDVVKQIFDFMCIAFTQTFFYSSFRKTWFAITGKAEAATEKSNIYIYILLIWVRCDDK